MPRAAACLAAIALTGCNPVRTTRAASQPARSSGVAEVLSSVCLPYVRDGVPQREVAKRARLRGGWEEGSLLSGSYHVGRTYTGVPGVSKLRLNDEQVIPAPGLISRSLCSFHPKGESAAWAPDVAQFVLQEGFRSSRPYVQPGMPQPSSDLQLMCSDRTPGLWFATWSDAEGVVVGLGRAPFSLGPCPQVAS